MSTTTAWSFTTNPASYPYAGAQARALCGYGTYNTGSVSYCSNCVTVGGKYCNLGASSASGTDCPAGSYCVAGTVKTAPPACAANTWSSAGASSCTACDAGKYVAAGAGIASASCV